MPMDRFVREIASLFSVHGHDVTRDAALEGRSGTIYTAPILAEKGGQAVLIDVRGPEEPVDAETVAHLNSVVADVAADVGVLVCFELDEAAADEAGALRIWTPEDLLPLIGAARLHDTAGTPLEPLPLTGLPEKVSDLLPAAFRDAVDLDGFETVGDAQDLLDATPAATDPMHAPEGLLADAPADPVDAVEDRAAEGSEAAVEGATPAMEAPEAPADTSAGDVPAPAVRAAHAVLTIQVTAEQAARAVRDKLFHVQGARLVLSPVHLFDYECDLLAGGSLRTETVAGRIQVDGTRKHAEEVDPRVIMPGDPEPPAIDAQVEQKELRIEPAKAEALARDLIMQAHTRMVAVEVKDEDGTYSYAEKRKVAPREENIRLVDLGVHHRPVWRLWGPNGHLDVDAVTGARLESALRNPNPDILVMD